MRRVVPGGTAAHRLGRPLPTVAVLAATLAVAAPVAAPTPAGAADYTIGFTWYSDGSFQKSGPGNTTITAYATGAFPNKAFTLVTSPVGQYDCWPGDYQPVNPNARVSSANGFIGLTSGAINRPPGNYEVCFLDLVHDIATAPARFTVV